MLTCKFIITIISTGETYNKHIFQKMCVCYFDNLFNIEASPYFTQNATSEEESSINFFFLKNNRIFKLSSLYFVYRL